MPKEVFEKLVWLFLLLPGFLCITVVGFIVDLSDVSEFALTFYSLILTLMTLLFAVPLYGGVHGLLSTRARAIFPTDQSKTYSFFVISIVIAILLGIGIGLAAESDRFYVALRSLPGTEILNKRSASRPLVFLLSQNTAGQLKESGDGRRAGKVTEAFVRVYMKDGAAYEGWPEFYGTGKTASEVYLSPACKVQNDGQSVVEVPGPGVLLIEGEIRAIELLDRPASPCYLLFARKGEKK